MPTPWYFDIERGQFYQPGVGFFDYLPDDFDYDTPITVIEKQVVPVYDGDNNIVSYEEHTYHDNAVWDTDAEAYGYYDFQGAFQWVAFPWTGSW